MELINDRKEALPLILDWIKANLTLNEVKEFRREAIAEELNTTSTNVSKTLHIIIQRGYIEYKQRKNVPSTYKLVKDLSGVTIEMVNAWTKEYDRQFLRNKKAAQPGNLENSTPFFEPLKSSFATVEPITEPAATLAPEAPKSRSQQLLEEALKLQQLAEEEAQREREAEEAAKQQPTQVEEPKPSEALTEIEARLNSVDQKVNSILAFFNQAYQNLQVVSPSPEAAPVVEDSPQAAPTTRTLLVRLVNNFAAADRKSEHETWKYLYGQFAIRTGFNVNDYPAKGERNGLNIVEQHGQMDNLYAMAKRLFNVSALK